MIASEHRFFECSKDENVLCEHSWEKEGDILMKSDESDIG